MAKVFLRLFLVMGLIFISCEESSSGQNRTTQKSTNEDSKKRTVGDSTVHQTENLIIQKLSDHSYTHISYLHTEDYGKVACNGMLIVNEGKGIVFDTPTDDTASLELLKFVANGLKSEVIALVPTHFHNDCIGGIKTFEQHNVPTYASHKTLELLKKNGETLPRKIQEFDSTLTLAVGNKRVDVVYFGEGHTKDNCVAYFPGDNVLFGGCLIKSDGAGKGYLGDANTLAWPETVRKIKLNYPNIEIVIPGHGKWGGTELLDYTIELFE